MSWLWLGAAVLFGIVEALTAGLVSIWFVAGAGAALIGGIALGRLYFPKIAPEEYSAAVRQRDDLARQAETLTQEKEALEETLTQLEDALEQSRAECAASAEQTAQLQEEAAALRQQLEDLEARYAETEETPE